MSGLFRFFAAGVLCYAVLAGQDAYPPSSGLPLDQIDPADQQHGVARVSFLGGNVNLQHGGGTAEPVAAVINAPLLSSDRLQTGSLASAEVQVDGNTVVRLAQNTDLGFAELQLGRARLQCGAGTIIFRSLRNSEFQTDIETPSIAIHPLGLADLRISVLENGSTQVTVRGGEADIYGPAGSQRLETSRSVLVRANASGPEFQEVYPPAHDSIDDWSLARDSQMLSASSYQYAGGEMAGVGDLDANGDWVESQYGNVWTPRTTTPGWSPYSEGQWVDEPYYGWTWVDAQPWGWAPFHYGRWFWNGGHGWCWWPGRGVRQSWGPAYVGFFGYGSGRGLGWVALAPHEGFHSWWGRGNSGGFGAAYAGRNGVFGNYQNAAFRGGAVGGAFGSFGGYRGRFNSLPRETLASGSVIRGPLPVNSTAYRFRLSDRQAVPNSRLSLAQNRSFVQAPRSGYGSAYRVTPEQGYRAAPQYRSPSQYSAPSPYRGSSAGTPSAQGWQHFGDPRMPANNRQSFRPAPSQSSGESGWHQFGRPERARPSGDQNSQPGSSYRQAPSYRQSPPASASPSRGFSGFGGGGGGGQYRNNSSPSRNEGNRGNGGSRGGGQGGNAGRHR